ncbi:MAG TPA: aminotransferase class I/II-fold pyridoxal phosphate-dependent enzyme [Terriglobales bacterium]|nr:aminotransferase class I/II-fold pyridoxal phosphate-dependent enzyme [Terriglobales bacterium]
MANIRSSAGSEYMRWAKLYSGAKHNLATSGIANFPLAELGVTIDQLEINGPTVYGYPPLLEAIAARYRVDRENVASAMGTSLANYLALAAATEPGDELLIEQPTYDPILGVARYLDLEIRRFARPAEKGFGIDLEDLERNLSPRTRVIALCNLHNPSGALVHSSVLREVAELARKSGAYVLVDEVYREMLFEAQPQSAFHIDPEQFIVTSSLTKAYGLSGLRCGWVLAPRELARRMWNLHDIHAGTYPFIAEALSVIAFEKLPEIAARTKAMLEENRRLLRDFLKQQDALEYIWPEYGTVVFPRLKQGKVDDFCEVLRRDFDASVVPGRFFEMPDRFRMGVGIATEQVRAALEQLGAALERYRAREERMQKV